MGQRKLCGFRNREHHSYKTAIYFHCGALISLSQTGSVSITGRLDHPRVVVTHSVAGGLRFKDDEVRLLVTDAGNDDSGTVGVTSLVSIHARSWDPTWGPGSGSPEGAEGAFFHRLSRNP